MTLAPTSRPWLAPSVGAVLRVVAGLAVLIAGLVSDHTGVPLGTASWLGALFLMGLGGTEAAKARSEWLAVHQAPPSPYDQREVQEALRVVDIVERHGSRVVQLAVEKVLQARALQSAQAHVMKGGSDAGTDD